MNTSVAGFLVCAALIVISGSRLAHHGDRIAELSGWGKAWLGLILMAAVTSLPELLTGISSVRIVKDPDLAAGDVFGSCMFNLLMLSLLDARLKTPLSSLVRNSHVVAAFFGILLLFLAGVGLVTAHDFPAIAWFSSITPVMIGMYLLAIWSIHGFEKNTGSGSSGPISSDKKQLLSSTKAYAWNALIVIVAALFLPYFGDRIAQRTGMGSSFFGTSILAAATSLPEFVVSLAAVRMGSYDMAVGNLLGSNMFNILVLGIDDLAYAEGSLFASISEVHLLSVLATMAMTAVAGLGMMIKPRRKAFWVFSLDALAIIMIYVVLMVYLNQAAP